MRVNSVILTHPTSVFAPYSAYLFTAAHLGWRKRKSAPKLTPWHKAARISWAPNFLTSSESTRKNTVATDEKRFCLDGPDNLNY